MGRFVCHVFFWYHQKEVMELRLSLVGVLILQETCMAVSYLHQAYHCTIKKKPFDVICLELSVWNYIPHTANNHRGSNLSSKWI